MTDYTAQEIEQAVNGLYNSESGEIEDGIEESWDEISYGDGPDTLRLRGEEVPLKHVKQEGGEGEGDEIWCVIQVGTQLFRKEGYYASHYGSDWDGELYECEIVERMVQFYEYKEGGSKA